MHVLYGREQPLRTLIDPSNSVVLVTGDGGVGKSTLLSACRDTAQESRLAVVNITRLPHRTGGLQVSILSQLASITTELASEQNTAIRFGKKVADRARAAIGSRRKDFALAIAKELLVIIKERVGSDTGQALGELFADISTDNSESILKVLQTQVDSDALQALVDIADEVASLSGAPVLYLFFENAQNLSGEDLRQLADLPAMLSDKVALRLEHRDSSDEHRRRIRLLNSAGVVEVSLKGLPEEVVSFWCRTKGVQESLHKRIYHSTNGYPLFVDDAINQVIAKRRLSNISPAENFRVSTVDSLNDLDPEAAAAARQLAAFIDPPNQEQIVSILGNGMTAVHWEGVSSRLERSRIFTTSASGIPWFHEVRRRCIWESLSAPIRREASDRAVSFILTSFRETQEPELLVNLAIIASDSSEVENDPRAKHLSQATLDEVALLSALLEIAEADKASPSPELPTAMGDSVLDYCRLTFMADIDALPALERLRLAEIVIVAENDNAAVLIPRLSELALLLALGRAGAELARFPMPAIASVIFKTVISPRLHSFVTCSYGVGYPRLVKIINNGTRAHRIERPEHPYGRSTHAVFLRASIEQQPFYAYSTFPDVETATRSTQDLAGAAGRHWGLRVDIDWLLQLPTERIRSERFANALKRIRFTPRPGLSFTNEVSKKAELLRYVRASCNRLERAALDLEETTSYFVLEKEQHTMVVEVTGGGDGVRKLDTSAPDDYNFTGPYKWANLKRKLNLSSGERTSNITFGSGGAISNDPKKIIEGLATKAREYNKHQPTLSISHSGTALQDALSASQRDTYYDAQALCAVLSQYGAVSLTPHRTLLLIYTHGQEGRNFGWDHSEAVYLQIPEPDLSHDVVTVKVIECENMNFETEIFGTEFAEELAEIPEVADGRKDWRMHLGMSVTSHFLCRELGYEDGAVRFHP